MPSGRGLHLSFDQLVDSSVIEDRMKTALARIAEKVAANAETEQTPQVS